MRRIARAICVSIGGLTAMWLLMVPMASAGVHSASSYSGSSRSSMGLTSMLQQADLALKKTDSPDPVRIGYELQYEL